MKINYKALGGKIRQIRLRHNLTIEQLAEIMNLSASYVGLIERGQRGISIEILHKFSQTFNISTDYLLSSDMAEDSSEYSSAFSPYHQQIINLTLAYSKADMEFLIEFIKLKNSYSR